MATRPMLIAQVDPPHATRGGDWFYRTFAPGRAMATGDGVYVVNLDQVHRKRDLILEQADVVVLNGVCNPDLLPIIRRRRDAGALTVFEINDDMGAVPAWSPVSAFFASPENVRLFRRIAQSCDAVQYSVDELMRCYGHLNPRGRVFPNQVVALPPRRAAPAVPSDGLVIGWGGSSGHLDDMAAVAGALSGFVLRHPQVTLHLMCSDAIWRLFGALPEGRKRRTAPGSIEAYFDFVAGLDVGIAPIADTAFNRSRSDVKFLEYAGWGAVPVVQSLTPYLGTVRDGDNGFLFATPEELVAVLEALAADPAARERVRARAYDSVRSGRLMADHAGDRVAYYDELLAEPGRPPRAVGDPARLLADIATWEGAEVVGRHAVLSHTRFESLLHDGLVLLGQDGDVKRGTEMLRAAAALEPQHPLPYLYLGCHLQGEADLGEALRRDPRSIQGRLALGSALLARGEPAAGFQQFLAAAELFPAYEMPYAHAARALRQLGNTKEADHFDRMAGGFARSVAPPTPSSDRGEESER
ncbi:MAG: glycosyltransferase [Deltaproteobacteria bacterium]|nr:glycosyltransferase [Myxococcales bacterium]MDP3218786.1 glycosyltransferase [Deltaproteobacteria bacterium]